MSRIGKMPIKIPPEVTVNISGKNVAVSGPKGTLEFLIPKQIEALREDDQLCLKIESPSSSVSALYGLTRALLANNVRGVSEGFRKELELQGVGYRAQVEGADLSLTIGFSHPVKFKAPQGITFKVLENKIIIEGADKQLVGEVASQIRDLKPPEPYKGKGIRYTGEKIRRKIGKAAKAIGGGK